MTFSPPAEFIWADGPANAPQQPNKQQIRVWAKQVETILDAFSTDGGLIYTSRASLLADLSAPANRQAWVVLDATPSYNGIYQKNGASGSGTWTRVSDLPFSFIVATDAGAGSANAIKATSLLPVSQSALVWVSAYRANTGSPVTISFNGDAPLTVKTNSGLNPVIAGIAPNMTLLGIRVGNVFRLVSDQTSSAIQAAAEAAAASALAYSNTAAAVMTTVLDPKFGNRAAAIAYNPTVSPTYINIAGYASSGDGGGGLYRKVATAPTHNGKIQIANGTWYELAEPVPSPEMFGAVGDGVADDTASIASARAFVGTPGRINLLPGKIYLVSPYTNAEGVTFVGQGKVVTAVTGGQWQHNNYGDNLQLHRGHEYLNRVYQFMHLGQGAAGGKFALNLYGDSTMTDGYGDDGPSVAITRSFNAGGVVNFALTNKAVAGTTWSDFPGQADVSTTDFMIIKYGINDPANGTDMKSRLAALVTNMDAKLSALRAVRGVGTLSIILVGPTSTSDSPNNRDERWYENLRGIYVAMARKYQCAYYDAYGQWSDSRGAAGIWMTDDFGDGRAIHPASQMNNWVWGKIIDEFFPRGALSHITQSGVINYGSQAALLGVNTPPSSFEAAVTSIRAVAATYLWPVDGFCFTFANTDGGRLQLLFNTSGSAAVLQVRTGLTTTNAWSNWRSL